MTPAHTDRRLSVDIGSAARVFLIAFIRIITQNLLFVKPFFHFFSIFVKSGFTQYAFSGQASHFGFLAVQVSRPKCTI